MKRLTLIVDNYPYREGLETDWGFSALLEIEGHVILFDLGADPAVFEHNIDVLGIDLSKIEHLFVSHYDSDHIGGLEIFLSRNEKATIHVPDNPQMYGINEKLKKRGHEVVVHSRPGTVIEELVFSTGTVEGSPRPEHSMYFKGKKGWVIVAGCSHPKVWNIARRVMEITGGAVELYIGGYHFYRLKGEELEEAVELVKESGIEMVAPCHCTGDEGRKMLKELYGEKFVEVGVGKVLEWC